MSFLDKAKEFADKHDEQVDQALEKAGDLIDKRTGGKYSATSTRPWTRPSNAPGPAIPSSSAGAQGGRRRPAARRLDRQRDGRRVVVHRKHRRVYGELLSRSRNAPAAAVTSVFRVFPAVPHRPGDRVRVVPATAVLPAGAQSQRQNAGPSSGSQRRILSAGRPRCAAGATAPRSGSRASRRPTPARSVFRR